MKYRKKMVLLLYITVIILIFPFSVKAGNKDMSQSANQETEVKDDNSVRRFIVANAPKLGISALLGLTLSSVVTYSKSKELKTVQHAVAADFYAEQFNLTESSDLFLYSQHFVTKRPTSNNES